MDKELDYIAKRYRKGRFDADAGWKSMGIANISLWKRYRAAAAIAATVVITATAALIYHEFGKVDATQQPIETGVPETPVKNPMAEIRVIDFENAPLTEVVSRIEAVYTVKVENLPQDGKVYRLSLHYEGTPTDLIDVINDILGTQMTVIEK